MRRPDLPIIRRITVLVLALVAAILLPAHVWAQQQPDQALMQVGIDLLYTKNDPTAAVAQFRKVLQQNPGHYGATFQLATALERAAQSDEALKVWASVLRMAEENKDWQTATEARGRLAQETIAQAAIMKAGLNLLYMKAQPIAAGAIFEEVLERNPAHYGATFQLAMALERAGKAPGARLQWEKVLVMAEAVNDSETAATARSRLGTPPK